MLLLLNLLNIQQSVVGLRFELILSDAFTLYAFLLIQVERGLMEHQLLIHSWYA